jgi:hypothetical protein
MAIDEEALRTPTIEEGRKKETTNELQTLNTANSNESLRIKINNHHALIPDEPMSGAFRLPLRMHDLQQHKKQPPRLLHP